jgi:hemerythrin-like domain-containing protein
MSACEHLKTDHRAMEARLDRLFRALEHMSPELVPEVQAAVAGIQRLAAIHFEKEEGVFYPSLQAAYPDVLSEMDRQHEHVRELERHVAGMLEDPPQPPDPRWLNELRMFGIEFHDHIQHHIVDEEDHLFRLAEALLTAEDQERLAAEMSRIQLR